MKEKNISGRIIIAMGGNSLIRDKHNSVEDQFWQLVDAVFDKDFASGLLTQKLNADLYIISTGVEKVCLNFNTPDEKRLNNITVGEAEDYLKAGHFVQGSMLPKIEACIEFVKATGKKALITFPECILKGVRGEKGTLIVPVL